MGIHPRSLRLAYRQTLHRVRKKISTSFKHRISKTAAFPISEHGTGAGTLKNPDLMDILMCPHCRSSFVVEDRLRCQRCGRSFHHVDGVPIITRRPNAYINRNSLEYERTNPYSEAAVQIIREHEAGLVLDFGAGFPSDEQIFPHVVRVDMIYYPTTTVVCDTPVLPFQDDCFDAIICESVFEHLPNPFHFADEALRVLKPDGEIRVDTAFLQPYHMDPDHYFNLTIPGLREVFRKFEEIETGVAPYQRASYTVSLILAAYAEHVPDNEIRDLIHKLLEMPLREMDNMIGEGVHTSLAAGVFFHGRKRR